MQARECQSQIARQELEIQLLDINNRYLHDGNNRFSYILQKQNIELKIKTLKESRNSHIYNAIRYAMQLAEIEINQNASYSMAAIAINSINSFSVLRDIKEYFMVPYDLREKILQAYNKLSLSTSFNSFLLTEIANLKKLCHI